MLQTLDIVAFMGEVIMIKRVLIYDPVPFKGGSKEVMKTILTELPSNIEVWVISNDFESWRGGNVQFMPLFSPSFLLKQTTGIGYFLKHFIFLFSLFFTLCKLKRFTKIIGLSGPCVDFSLYLLTEIIKIDIVQLIQGDIANSKVAGFGLTRAKQVFYLPSTLDSIVQTLETYGQHQHIAKENFSPFVNGIDSSTIKAKVSNEKVGFLWAASLSKWKRIELFVAAMTELNNIHGEVDDFFASVCYIKPPAAAHVDITNLDKDKNVHWYSDPDNLNDIRANSSVFISTSEHEPFGLSILESMAAGLAIVIPEDGAYWDQHLTDGHDCVKYEPNNVESLVKALTRLLDDPSLLSVLSHQAKVSAQNYCHLHCYSNILKCIPN